MHNDSTTAATNLTKLNYSNSIFTQSNLCPPNISDLPVLDNYLDSIHFTEQDVLEAFKQSKSKQGQ